MNQASSLDGGPIVIALAFDSKYVAPAATVMRSCLLRHSGEALQFEVIHDGSLSVLDRRRVEAMCQKDGAKVHFHLIDRKRVADLPLVDRFGSIVWARMFLPDFLESVPRALYLDCDTLVLSSLHSLWHAELGGCALGAVANVVEPPVREHVAKLGVRYPGGFFNSGVLLFDLELMRAGQYRAELVRFGRSHPDKLIWPDQEALNVVFDGRWCSLHPRWNAQNSLWYWHEWAMEVFGPDQVSEAMNDPVIRHFEGPGVAKPWHYLCPTPHRDLYLETLSRTPWAGEPLQDRTASTRIITRLPERWQLPAYRRVVAARSTVKSAWKNVDSR